MNEAAEVDQYELSEDFDSGFENAPSPTETPGKVAEEPAVEQQPATPAVEYAQVTKAELDELKARAALVDQIKATQEKSFGTAFGKIGGLERELQQLRSGKRVEIKQEDIDALRDDFPPLAAGLEKLRDLQMIVAPDIDHAKIDEMVQSRMAPALESIDTRVSQAVEKRLLLKAHPDYATVEASKEFMDWAMAQPEDYRKKLATSWDSDFISSALTKFKERAKPPAPAPNAAAARRSRMQAAVTPRGSGGVPAPDPESEFDAGFKTG